MTNPSFKVRHHAKLLLGTRYRSLERVIRDTLLHIRDAELTMSASSLAYTTILSIIPLIAVSFAIFQAFGGLEKIFATVEPFIIENLAQGSGEVAMSAIRDSVGKIHAGAMGVGGMIGLIFTTMSMLGSAEKAINRVWGVRSDRPIFYRIASYWLLITLGPLALAVVIGYVTSFDLPVRHLIPAGTAGIFIYGSFFFFVYKVVPHRSVDWKAALGGTLFSTFGGAAAKSGYAYYTRNFVSYDKIYGSLGAIPIFFLWIYIVWFIILVGAALCVSLQRYFEGRYHRERA